MGLMTHLSFAGNFGFGNLTANAGTVINQLIPGQPILGGSWPLYDFSKAVGSKVGARFLAHLSKVIYTTAAQAHVLTCLRPKNYTWATAAAATGQAVITVKDDPGIYSTNYKYTIPNSNNVCQVADHGMALNDWVAFQLADGTWVVAQVSSLSGTTLTLATNIPVGTATTNNGVLPGSPIYYYGTTALSDPATGQADPATKIAASSTRDTSWTDTEYGIVAALHPGDPLLLQSANGGYQGTFDWIGGFYAQL